MSKFVETRNNVFDEAGITLKQAELLEYLFLWESATYSGLASYFGTTNNAIGRMVSALRKKGMVRRYILGSQGDQFSNWSDDPVPCDEWEVWLSGNAWDVRKRFKAWDEWLTKEEARLRAKMKEPRTSQEVSSPSIHAERE